MRCMWNQCHRQRVQIANKALEEHVRHNLDQEGLTAYMLVLFLSSVFQFTSIHSLMAEFSFLDLLYITYFFPPDLFTGAVVKLRTASMIPCSYEIQLRFLQQHCNLSSGGGLASDLQGLAEGAAGLSRRATLLHIQVLRTLPVFLCN